MNSSNCAPVNLWPRCTNHLIVWPSKHREIHSTANRMRKVMKFVIESRSKRMKHVHVYIRRRWMCLVGAPAWRLARGMDEGKRNVRTLTKETIHIGWRHSKARLKKKKPPNKIKTGRPQYIVYRMCTTPEWSKVTKCAAHFRNNCCKKVNTSVVAPETHRPTQKMRKNPTNIVKHHYKALWSPK